MSASRKQHADLIRHRELNALRRLMITRQSPSVPTLKPLTQSNKQAASHQALDHINRLETEMSVRFDSAEHFLSTQIQTLDSQTLPTTLMQQTINAVQSIDNIIAQVASDFAAHQWGLVQKTLERAISPNHDRHDHIPTWLALFDFYRASDQPARFDSLALAFSIRFGRSTPSWISIPQAALAAQHAWGAAPASTSPSRNHSDWIAPSHPSPIDCDRLLAALKAHPYPPTTFAIDWRALEQVDASLYLPLQKTFHAIAEQTTPITAYGIDTLEQALSNNTAAATLTRLALLRCQNKSAEFETLALEYCTQFEVSPPDWTAPVCQFESAVTLLADPLPLAATSVDAHKNQPELWGHLTEQLPSSLFVSSEITTVIRCDRLVRCDPAVIVQLEQWTRAQQTQGVRIEFQGVHRLIAAYFLAHGIYAHAKVSIRKD